MTSKFTFDTKPVMCIEKDAGRIKKIRADYQKFCQLTKQQVAGQISADGLAEAVNSLSPPLDLRRVASRIKGKIS